MNGKDDLLDDILPMVIYGILDPKYITGEEEPDRGEDEDRDEDNN